MSLDQTTWRYWTTLPPHNAPPSVSRFEECRSLSDTATQCCFDPIILVSVATQTDDVPTTVASDDLSDGSFSR